MTLRTERQLSVVPSKSFEDEELVLQSVPVLPDGPVALFGHLHMWDLNARERNPNRGPAHHRLRFTSISAEWNLRVREVAMIMLNPQHPQVRRHGIFLRRDPASVTTVRNVIGALRILVEWRADRDLDNHPASWRKAELHEFIAEMPSSNRRNYYKAIRMLHTYHGALTHGGLDRDPWAGVSAKTLGAQALPPRGLSTPAIPPETWWPLLRAAWLYVDRLSTDIFKARERWETLRTPPPPATARAPGNASVLLQWLQDSENFIPTHPHGVSNTPQFVMGEAPINWTILSRMVTGGRSRNMFIGSGNSVSNLRNIVSAPEYRNRRRIFNLLPDALEVESVEGAKPWVSEFTPTQLWHEVKMLRSACYIFVAALSMLRDSELQGIPRDSVRDHYGAPAIRTQHFKGDYARSVRHWWIIEPVVKALQVAEEISAHPSRIFTPIRKLSSSNSSISANPLITEFIDHINLNRSKLGLAYIPPHKVSPHTFRKTMSIITAQQPGGEIALGLTLKHVAIRALSNATTTRYSEPTPAWAEELQLGFKDATSVRLANCMRARLTGEIVAVGPGAKLFTAKLDKVAAEIPDLELAEGNVVDQRLVRDLLRQEFSNVKFGNLNACLGDLASARCLSEQDPDSDLVQGVNPARCQPQSCRNSVVTAAHRPLWVATEQDLLTALRDKKVAPTNRAHLEQELQGVRDVINQSGAT